MKKYKKLFLYGIKKLVEKLIYIFKILNIQKRQHILKCLKNSMCYKVIKSSMGYKRMVRKSFFEFMGLEFILMPHH